MTTKQFLIDTIAYTTSNYGQKVKSGNCNQRFSDRIEDKNWYQFKFYLRFF